MTINLDKTKFVDRHIGPGQQQINEMLETVGADSMEQFMKETVPSQIRIDKQPELGEPVDESDYADLIREMAKKNEVFTSYIGMGYYDTETPAVIQRNVLENPGWYTSYTPYQAEISQGRLEALINFQTMVCDLTGMELANASLLDEGTAAAEAMSLMYNRRKGKKKKEAHTFFVSENCHPQTIDVIYNRAEPQNIDIVVGDPEDLDVTDEELFGILLQNPDTEGKVADYTNIIEAAHEQNVLVTVATDLMALTMMKSPGEMGADVVIGSSQRFGVPMGYGGPHAAFFATREKYKRNVPGRIIGVTRDAEDNPAYRMALQTREQHIRREKATSNICTAQVLLAVIAGFYGVYHGPEGLRRIARRIHGMTKLVAKGVESLGYEIVHDQYFDTLKIGIEGLTSIDKVRKEAEKRKVNFRYYDDDYIGISIDEAKDVSDVKQVLHILAEASDQNIRIDVDQLAGQMEVDIPEDIQRKTDYMDHPVFNSFHSEHEMLRYLKRLENKDLSLVHSMISLGSCTMKLNPTTTMLPLSWPEFMDIHPFAPPEQAQGYSQLFEELKEQLIEITGLADVSLQPNSGAQGEYTGLMTIRSYHKDRGEEQRDVTIVPDSAHGTNPASAVMAGMEVVVTKCDDEGNIDLDDLREKVEQHKDRLAALMVTYPSTHGVFEEDIKDICDLIHENGGMVYLDGANMNAQVGWTSPAAIGADVCHLNLHKTFCIPHGGGGPGMGPIAVSDELQPFLPGHPISETGGEKATHAVSAAAWGSASILPISYGYIKLMGVEGLKKVSEAAILNANYLKDRLRKHYPILFTGKQGRSAHEFILDLRNFNKTAGVDSGDVAKRLMDYGFHAPTMSYPVPGTFMIEPTESENKEELDRFCEALISIREEIREIEQGEADEENNLLKNAPHTQRVALSDHWDRPYSRERAVFPLDYLRFDKFWSSVSRVDDAYGDRNLMCSCPPMEQYAEGQEPAPADS